MGHKCVLCRALGVNNNAVHLHKLPLRDEKLTAKWLAVIRGSLGEEKVLPKAIFVCSSHFLKTDFIPNAIVRRLKNDVIPTQNIPVRKNANDKEVSGTKILQKPHTSTPLGKENDANGENNVPKPAKAIFVEHSYFKRETISEPSVEDPVSAVFIVSNAPGPGCDQDENLESGSPLDWSIGPSEKVVEVPADDTTLLGEELVSLPSSRTIFTNTTTPPKMSSVSTQTSITVSPVVKYCRGKKQLYKTLAEQCSVRLDAISVAPQPLTQDLFKESSQLKKDKDKAEQKLKLIVANEENDNKLKEMSNKIQLLDLELKRERFKFFKLTRKWEREKKMVEKKSRQIKNLRAKLKRMDKKLKHPEAEMKAGEELAIKSHGPDLMLIYEKVTM